MAVPARALAAATDKWAAAVGELEHANEGLSSYTPVTDQHATDPHGVTLVNFGLVDLLGLQLSPRIRDLGRITRYRPGPPAEAEALFRMPVRCCPGAPIWI